MVATVDQRCTNDQFGVREPSMLAGHTHRGSPRQHGTFVSLSSGTIRASVINEGNQSWVSTCSWVR
jgi:hypothetical protein